MHDRRKPLRLGERVRETPRPSQPTASTTSPAEQPTAVISLDDASLFVLESGSRNAKTVAADGFDDITR
jgi:hypothetical protein